MLIQKKYIIKFYKNQEKISNSTINTKNLFFTSVNVKYRIAKHLFRQIPIPQSEKIESAALNNICTTKKH